MNYTETNHSTVTNLKHNSQQIFYLATGRGLKSQKKKGKKAKSHKASSWFLNHNNLKFRTNQFLHAVSFFLFPLQPCPSEAFVLFNTYIHLLVTYSLSEVHSLSQEYVTKTSNVLTNTQQQKSKKSEREKVERSHIPCSAELLA